MPELHRKAQMKEALAQLIEILIGVGLTALLT